MLQRFDSSPTTFDFTKYTSTQIQVRNYIPGNYGGILGKYVCILGKYGGILGKYGGILGKYGGILVKCGGILGNCSGISGKYGGILVKYVGILGKYGGISDKYSCILGKYVVAQDHLVNVGDGVHAGADREVAQVGRPLQPSHVLADALILLLCHL